jgi:polysaccharide pyruvyl transferase WcaK-like protein
MIILIFASVGFSNLGDELILKNEIELLRIQHIEKNPKFLVFSYDHKNPFYKKDYIEYKPYFPINIRKINNIILNIKNFFLFLYFLMKSDLIVIG